MDAPTSTTKATDHPTAWKVLVRTIGLYFLKLVVWVAHIIPHPKRRKCRRVGQTCCQLSLQALKDGRGLAGVMDILRECSGRPLKLPSRQHSWMRRATTYIALGIACGIMVGGGCGGGKVPCMPQVLTACTKNS